MQSVQGGLFVHVIRVLIERIKSRPYLERHRGRGAGKFKTVSKHAPPAANCGCVTIERTDCLHCRRDERDEPGMRFQLLRRHVLLAKEACTRCFATTLGHTRVQKCASLLTSLAECEKSIVYPSLPSVLGILEVIAVRVFVCRHVRTDLCSLCLTMAAFQSGYGHRAKPCELVFSRVPHPDKNSFDLSGGRSFVGFEGSERFELRSTRSCLFFTRKGSSWLCHPLSKDCYWKLVQGRTICFARKGIRCISVPDWTI